MSKLPSKTCAIVRMVLLDAAAFGACLVVFAYFHHVRITPLHPTALPESTQTPALETPAPDAPGVMLFSGKNPAVLTNFLHFSL